MSDEEKELLQQKIEQDLLSLFGTPILNLTQLQRALNYRSVAAMKQAMSRGTYPVAIFVLPNRRGKFSLAYDVAKFLVEQACKKTDEEKDRKNNGADIRNP